MVTFSTVLTSMAVVLTASNVYAQQKCEADHECPTDRFCYGSTKVCAPCIVCAAYNRNIGSRRCAREWQDCGPCLKGFRSEDINEVFQRGNCIMADVPHIDSPQPTVGTNNMTTSIPHQYVIVVALVLTLGSGGLYFVMKGHQRGQRQDVEGGCRGVPDEPLLRPPNGLPPDMPNLDRPPPIAGDDPPAYSQLKHPAQFSPANPSAPPAEGADCRDEASVTVFIGEKQDEELQQACPFQVAANIRFYPNGSDVEEVVEQEDDEESEAENASARSTPVNLNEDQSTLPSDWAPGDQELHHGGLLDDSGVCNISDSQSSSTVSPDAPPPPLNFHGLFAHGQLVVQARCDSSGAETGERPAKRFRVDSRSHSASSSSSEDETHYADLANSNVLNLGSVGE